MSIFDIPFENLNGKNKKKSKPSRVKNSDKTHPTKLEVSTTVDVICVKCDDDDISFDYDGFLNDSNIEDYFEISNSHGILSVKQIKDVDSCSLIINHVDDFNVITNNFTGTLTLEESYSKHITSNGSSSIKIKKLYSGDVTFVSKGAGHIHISELIDNTDLLISRIKIKSTGSSSIWLDKINHSQLEIKSSGTSNVKINENSLFMEDATVISSGASTCILKNISGSNLNVKTAGSSSVFLDCFDKIEVVSGGASSVTGAFSCNAEKLRTGAASIHLTKKVSKKPLFLK